MKIASKLLILSGIAVTLGASFVSLTSYATDSASQDVTVNVSVNDSISITATPSSVNFGSINPGSMTASANDVQVGLKVISNNVSGYTITASGGTLKRSTDDENPISCTTVVSGSSAYGFSTTDGSGWACNAPVLTNGTPTTASGTTTNVYFAISLSSTQPNGTYTGTVTFTATNKASS